MYGAVNRAVDGITFGSTGELFGFSGRTALGRRQQFGILATLLDATSGVARVAEFDVATQPYEALGDWGSRCRR